MYILFSVIILGAAAADLQIEQFVRPKDQEVYHLPPESLLKLQKFSLLCLRETNANTDVLGKLLAGTIEEDEASGAWLECLSLRGGYVDEQGHYVVDRMAGILGNHPLIQPFKEALKECNNITKQSRKDTIFEMVKCLQETSPVVMSL